MKIQGIMLIKFAMLLVLSSSIVASASVHCTCYDTGDDTLNQILCTVQTNGWVDLIQMSYVIGDAAESSKNTTENRKKLDLFVGYLYSLSFDTINLRERLAAIHRVYELILQTSRYYPNASDKERWEIRLKALEWKKKQLDRLLASPPEDNRPWPEKWQNPRAPRDSEKGQWDDVVFRFKSCFYKSDLRICVQAAEEERYSEDFREWCLKEIEKIIGRPLTDDDIMFKEDVLRRRAKRLIDRIPSSWEASVEAFTNVAYKACEAISKIDNPTKRLECAIAYGESLFKLDRFVRECDVQGYWARLNAHGMAKDILHELDVESKWIHAAKYRQLMKEELKYYEPLGSSTPMRMLKRNRWNEKEYEVLSKENEKRGKALKYRHFANKIKGGLQAFYKPAFEWSLKEDCSNLTSERKKALMKMLIEITGETPKWYQKELDEKKTEDR